MDGVIVDSEYHWKKGELTLFNQLLPKWTNEDQQKIIGMSMNEIYIILVKNYGLKINKSEFLEQVNKIATIVYMEQTKLSDGFMEVVNDLRKRNISISLASSALKIWINMVLDRFELHPFFNVIVSSEDINGASKPAPDIYLHTAKKLGVDPKECIVIEDSCNGVLSAKSAGMYCVGLRNGFNEAQDLSKADVIINGFGEFNDINIL